MRAKILLRLMACGIIGSGAEALEIYRIGGEDLPRPEQGGVIFHQLSWGEYVEKQGLDEEALARGVLRPIFARPEDNMARASIDRGGGPHIQPGVYASYTLTAESKTMADGDSRTFYEWVPGSNLGSALFLIPVDLGGLFPINRLRLICFQSGNYPDRVDIAANAKGVEDITQFLTFDYETASDQIGTFLAGSEMIYRLPENVRDTIDVSFSPRVARTVDLVLYRSSPKLVGIAEIEIYGEGYIAQASYVGPLIDLGGPAIWGDIQWRGRKDPEAEVWIQSRTGKDLDPNRYWRFTGRGDEISPLDEEGKPLDNLAYARLRSGETGPITYDTEHWSFWSPPYEFGDSTGTPFLSPGPNSVAQLRVDFANLLAQGGELSSVEFKATKPPLVEEVIGEVYPAEVPLGEIIQFTYAIRSTLDASHSGFDRIEIAAPFGLAGVDSVKIGGVPVDFSVRAEGADATRFSVQLPRHLGADKSGSLVKVVFRAPVLRYNTTFDGWVRDSQRPLELAQRINPGDAAGELPGETLSVRTSFSDKLVMGMQVQPKVFTPNGDGVNETVSFSFDLLQLTQDVPLRLEIYDLSGRLGRVVHAGLHQSGHLSFSWDGRDDNRQLLPPGLYVYRLALEAAKELTHQAGTIAMVY
jgi:hypothetical protein